MKSPSHLHKIWKTHLWITQKRNLNLSLISHTGCLTTSLFRRSSHSFLTRSYNLALKHFSLWKFNQIATLYQEVSVLPNQHFLEKRTTLSEVAISEFLWEWINRDTLNSEVCRFCANRKIGHCLWNLQNKKKKILEIKCWLNSGSQLVLLIAVAWPQSCWLLERIAGRVAPPLSTNQQWQGVPAW